MKPLLMILLDREEDGVRGLHPGGGDRCAEASNAAAAALKAATPATSRETGAGSAPAAAKLAGVHGGGEVVGSRRQAVGQEPAVQLSGDAEDELRELRQVIPIHEFRGLAVRMIERVVRLVGRFELHAGDAGRRERPLVVP